MPISVPDNPKVQTTTYDNFRGVDFTNDATNVWRRRSPTGTNMIPDASGRPFKRKGWEILLSQEDLCNILGEVECEITKVEYFELAGVDHIVVFTNVGVIFYSKLFDAESQYVISKDNDCFGSYDRCFFFEGISTGNILGDLTALLSGVFYAGVFMLNQFERGDALSSMFFGQLMCGVFLSPFVLKETQFTALILTAVFVLGTVQVGLAYILFSIGTRYTDPVTASVINAIEPILNPILVAVFYGEKIGRLALIGAAIVIGGVLFYNVAGTSRQRI